MHDKNKEKVAINNKSTVMDHEQGRVHSFVINSMRSISINVNIHNDH